MEYFRRNLSEDHYPYYFESRKVYHALVENMVNYMIDVELISFCILPAKNKMKRIYLLLPILGVLLCGRQVVYAETFYTRYFVVEPGVMLPYGHDEKTDYSGTFY